MSRQIGGGGGAPDEHSHTSSNDGGSGVGPTDVSVDGSTFTDPAGNEITASVGSWAGTSYSTAGQTASDTAEELDLTEEDGAQSDYWDLSNNAFNVPEDGSYLLHLQTRWLSGGTIFSIIEVNGTEVTRLENQYDGRV